MDTERQRKKQRSNYCKVDTQTEPIVWDRQTDKQTDSCITCDSSVSPLINR